MGEIQEQTIARIMGDFYDRIAQRYREIVSNIEGSEPTDEEIKEHGQRLLTQDGKTILAWKGIPIIEWGAWPIQWGKDGTKATITFNAHTITTNESFNQSN